MVGGSEYEKGDFLKNIGFEFIRRKRGDFILLNVVMIGVIEVDGLLFVGRVGGSIFCYIIIKDGKI